MRLWIDGRPCFLPAFQHLFPTRPPAWQGLKSRVDELQVALANKAADAADTAFNLKQAHADEVARMTAAHASETEGMAANHAAAVAELQQRLRTAAEEEEARWVFAFLERGG